MKGSITIGKLAGIKIGVHYTWVFALGLFTWLFAMGTFPAVFPSWSTIEYWIGGIVVSLLIFVSILTHEMAHSIVARHRGMQVNSIILFIFGGVSNIEKEPEQAWTEFVMAGVGPLASLMMAGIFYGLAMAARATLGITSSVYGVLIVTALVNVLTAIFNIVPGFPLDGGRVLRSIIWGITRNLHTATVIAGNVGRVIGWIMVLFGIANLITRVNFNLFQGDLLNGIWFIFIGYFLISAANTAMAEEDMQRKITDMKVKDVMETQPECVSPVAPIEGVVHDSFIKRSRRALPVCDASGLLGIVTLSDLKKVPKDKWATSTVQAVMTRAPLQTVDQNGDLNEALHILSRSDLNQIPVMNDGHMVGLLSRANVIKYLESKEPSRSKGSRVPVSGAEK